jgi:carbon-monoxide dehydrogenase small subunit
MPQAITFNVNGRQVTVNTDPQRTLLEVLREDLDLKGTKYGCGEARCGACTVLLDDEAVYSCRTPIADVANRKVLTIEGLAKGDALHPVQQAFIAEEAFQCGYCTPGMVVRTVALLKRIPHPTDAEIVAGLNGHLCRCCGYPKIIKAVRRAAQTGSGS